MSESTGGPNPRDKHHAGRLTSVGVNGALAILPLVC